MGWKPWLGHLSTDGWDQIQFVYSRVYATNLYCNLFSWNLETLHWGHFFASGGTTARNQNILLYGKRKELNELKRVGQVRPLDFRLSGSCSPHQTLDCRESEEVRERWGVLVLQVESEERSSAYLRKDELRAIWLPLLPTDRALEHRRRTVDNWITKHVIY